MIITSPRRIRERLWEYLDRPHDEIGNGDRGAVIGAIEGALTQPSPIHDEMSAEEMRYLIFGFCFTDGNELLTQLRSSDLTDDQFFALKKWIGFWKDDNDQWQERESFYWECRQMFTLATVVLDRTWSVHSGEPLDEAMPMMDWMKEWNRSEMDIDVEENGLVQSAIGFLGGAVQYAPDPPENFTGKPVNPSDNYREAPHEVEKLQPEDGWVDWI